MYPIVEAGFSKAQYLIMIFPFFIETTLSCQLPSGYIQLILFLKTRCGNKVWLYSYFFCDNKIPQLYIKQTASAVTIQPTVIPVPLKHFMMICTHVWVDPVTCTEIKKPGNIELIGERKAI